MPGAADATDSLSEKCAERTTTPIQWVQVCPIDLLFDSDEEMMFVMQDHGCEVGVQASLLVSDCELSQAIVVIDYSKCPDFMDCEKILVQSFENLINPPQVPAPAKTYHPEREPDMILAGVPVWFHTGPETLTDEIHGLSDYSVIEVDPVMDLIWPGLALVDEVISYLPTNELNRLVQECYAHAER